jgi:hypothetical protein
MEEKSISLRPSCSKDTFASELAGEFNDNERASGNGFPHDLPLTTSPPRTYAAMTTAKLNCPACPTKANNLNSVFSPIPPEGPADDLTAEQKNKMTRSTLRTQHLINFPERTNKGSVTTALYKWKQHILYHTTETANTTVIKVGARAGKNTPIETYAAGQQHTYTKIKHTDTIQCFLKGPTHETFTIDVPSPVTFEELGEAIAKKTRVPAGE